MTKPDCGCYANSPAGGSPAAIDAARKPEREAAKEGSDPALFIGFGGRKG